MLITVTPNPSLDLLFTADRVVWDDANRIPTPRRRPGGQGINLVRAARSLEPDTPTCAIAPLGGQLGDEIEQRLSAEGTPFRKVPLAGETRVFVGVRERDTGRSLLLNPRGPAAPPGLVDDLIAATEAELERAGAGAWVAGCGSLLPGLPTDFYAEIGRLAHHHGARFVPDCDGDALAAAATAADLLVPNDMEAARLVGRTVRTPAEAAAAGRLLLEKGVARVVITMGERGAVGVTHAGAWWARPQPPAKLARELEAGTAVGAGDAFLAALLLADHRQDDAGLARAVAAGTAVLLAGGAALVTAPDAQRVQPHVTVERQDP